MKKLGLFIILILFCVVSYSQNNAVYKRVSLDTLKSRTGTKKMYLKDTVIINNIIRIPAGATDGNIAYSNANGDVIWGTLPSEADSLFVTYCCGCNMIDGWKALEDTIKIDTCYVNQIIKDSLNAHWIILSSYIQDSADVVHWSDTLTDIATKHDVDTLSNSVYDSLGNHYDLIHALDTGKVSTSGDIMYGELVVNAKITATDTIKAPYLKVTNEYTLPTIDGTAGQGIVTNGAGVLTWGMSFDSLKCYTKLFMDTVESCINQLYLKADTTTISSFFKLKKYTNNLTEPVLKVLPSGRIDTNETRSIMGLYLDSLDVGEIDVNTLNSDTANITTANTVTAIEQNLVLPNFGSNYKPVLSIANLSGDVDTTQVKLISSVTLDSLKIDKYVVIGGVKSEDVKFTLADDGVYSFAETSYGFASLYSYNAGKMTSLVRYTFDSDGTIYMETSTPLVNGADADGYEICLYYSAGSYYIKNTSGGNRNYILTIKKY